MKTKAFFSALILLTTLSCLGQWSYDNLSEPKYRQGVATLGTKAYFIAGANDSLDLSAIEIYDVATESWDSTINLPVPRSHPSCVAAGNKILVAGGVNFFNLSHFDEVYIWDTQTKEWRTEHLLFPRFSISAVSHGNKVLFAGGANLINGVVYNVVEIYDIDTHEWDFTALSMGRASMASAVVDDLALFAGGYDLSTVTDRVDIYNFTTNTWTTATLSEPRGFLAGATAGSRVLFAGGVRPDNTVSDRVDIYDAETNTWSTSTLSEPRAMFQEAAATVSGMKAFFAGGGEFDLILNIWNSGSDVIDIYDAVSDTWSVEHLIAPIIMSASTGVEDHFITAGGVDYTWQDSLFLISDVEIYVDPFSGIGEEDGIVTDESSISVYPNPTRGIVDIRFTIYDVRYTTLKVYNAQGQEVATLLDEMCYGDKVVRWDMSRLPAGIYYYRLTTDDPSSRKAGLRTGRRLTTGKLVKY